jgi:hypothetical protein
MQQPDAGLGQEPIPALPAGARGRCPSALSAPRRIQTGGLPSGIAVSSEVVQNPGRSPESTSETLEEEDHG